MEQLFIDRFIMPQSAKAEFMERMAINRDLIKTLPGFIRDDAYVSNDNEDNFRCITIAVWANETVLKEAKQYVQAEYQRQGFDMPAMLARLDISMERAQYFRLEDSAQLQ